MYNPKDVFTESGLKEYQMQLYLLEHALSFILNQADDLHLGCNEGDNSLDTLYAMQRLIESRLLETGDGEIDEYKEERERIMKQWRV